MYFNRNHSTEITYQHFEAQGSVSAATYLLSWKPSGNSSQSYLLCNMQLATARI
jgi:hypothetical protein